MANVTLRNVRKTYRRRLRGHQGHRFRGRRRPVLRAGRPLRLRQVHAAAHGRGAGDHHRRARSTSAAASSTQIEPADRDIAMVFQNYALYPHMSVYNNMAYGLRNRGMAEARDRHPRAGSRAHSRTRRRCSSASRGSCPAASASASRWAAPSCGSRRCSCSTSRCPISTPSCASRCGSRSANCSAGSPPPRSTSPTTSSRR